MTPFASRFEQKVLRSIRKFKLISKGDRVLVAVSGGKDSTSALYILNKHLGNVEAVTINAFIGSYSKKSLDNIKAFCSEQKIPLHVVSFREAFGKSLCYMRSALRAKGIRMTSCAICGILKRYLLNKKALELRADKLATGHNLDDEAQSIMLSLLRCNIGAMARLGPRSGVLEDKKFVPRIKPLYLTAESEVEKYSKLRGFPVAYEACPCSANASRRLVGNLLDEMEKKNPDVKRNIVNFFLKNSSRLKKEYSKEKARYCSKCQMPSKSDMCRTCQIVGVLKS